MKKILQVLMLMGFQGLLLTEAARLILEVSIGAQNLSGSAPIID